MLHSAAQQKPLQYSDRHTVTVPSNAGLTSIAGAEWVITEVKSRKVVSKLNVAHNRLGGDGFSKLFEYLHSDEGRKYEIEYLDVHNCDMDDIALKALSAYVQDNPHVRTLMMQQNDFGRDRAVMKEFIAALNRSRVKAVLLSAMPPEAAAASVNMMMETLTTPYLHELTVSYNRLPLSCAPRMASFLLSPRCRLRVFRVSANDLGVAGMRVIVGAMERNYSLHALEMFANWYHLSDEGETEETLEKLHAHKVKLLTRNDQLRTAVEAQSLDLLRAARVLLSIPKHVADGRDVPVYTDLWHRLPIEIRQYLLRSTLAPTLSPAQQLDVIKYATDRSTLPPLLPTLRSRGCVRDPALPSFDGVSTCSDGTCQSSGSLICKRDEQRLDWRIRVGCDVYSPPPEQSSPP